MRLLEVLSGTALPSPPEDREITGICFDTRELQPGELFIALPGYQTDGRLYVAEAVQKGASAIVAEAGDLPDVGQRGGVPVLPARDSRLALAQLSANWFHHPGKELTLVGVTGTNGKTTVTTLLSELLHRVTGAKTGLMGTNRVSIGEKSYPARRTTPESWEIQRWLRQMADEGCRYVVMEVSSHALCLQRVYGLHFAVGAFTNLTQDHLDFHGTMDAYQKAKQKLFEQSGTAALNWDDEAGRAYARQICCPVLAYSARGDPGASLTAEQIRLFPDRVAFLAVSRAGRFPAQVPIPGLFTVSNALCVLACCLGLKLPLGPCAGALERLSPVRGRMEVVPTPGPGLVMIDYAHTPDALEKALTALRDFTKGRVFCLFGCGGDRDRGKRPLMGEIAGKLSHRCIVTSDNPRTEDPLQIIEDILSGMDGAVSPPLVEPDREKAIALALGLLEKDDVLLLAGKGHETYQEMGGVRRHMDEREFVLANAVRL